MIVANGMGGVFNMELPKNITQIGETNPHCKVYVEDYVISYIKQLNQYAGEKELPVALYGTRKEEDGITYLFLYGACRLAFVPGGSAGSGKAEEKVFFRFYFPGISFAER